MHDVGFVVVQLLAGSLLLVLVIEVAKLNRLSLSNVMVSRLFGLTRVVILCFQVYTMTAEELKWSLCCLCRTNDGREIRSPAQYKCKDRGAGYESLSNALSLFEGSHSSIPISSY